MHSKLAADVSAIEAIGEIPTILQAVAEFTGLGFVCVARVTEEKWIACAVLDNLQFGLKPGDELQLATTLCNEVRANDKAIVIDHVAEDPVYCGHHTPAAYGFESYVSIPIYRTNGEFFGTLCGLDPKPVALRANSALLATMDLFTRLIALQLEREQALEESQAALLNEKETAELREQFIAVLGHDVRTPLSSIVAGVDLLRREALGPRAQNVVERIGRSVRRIAALVDDVVDFTRGRMGGGIALTMREEPALAAAFEQAIAECSDAHPDSVVHSTIALPDAVVCDATRIVQLFSNLLNNALVHGDRSRPVEVAITGEGGALRIGVVNHGPAIPPAMLQQLFKPYWRAVSRAGHQGLGLGLFIVSEIARSHGGRIEVVSSDERTEFIFELAASGANGTLAA